MKHRYTTAQVVAILSRHHDWTAGTLSSPNKSDERCSYKNGEFLFQFLNAEGEWETNDVSSIPDRDDWEIVRPKRKRGHVGELGFQNGCSYYTVDFSKLDKSKTYKLVAVEE